MEILIFTTLNFCLSLFPLTKLDWLLPPPTGETDGMIKLDGKFRKLFHMTGESGKLNEAKLMKKLSLKKSQLQRQL